MHKRLKTTTSNLFFIKLISIFSLILPLNYFTTIFEAKAGLEFQWDNENGYKKLKWYQTDSENRARNTTYYFLRPSDRKSGLLKIDMKFPKKFKTNLKKEKINLCKVNIGGFESRTKCLEDIPAEFELSKDQGKTNLTIYPYAPLPSSKDSYAVVVKSFNPTRSGLYQVHSYGQSAGKVAVSSYIGSWTIVID